jgi:hypothetical protein
LQLPTSSLSDEAGRIKAVQAVATCYNERCVSFCDRVEKCRQAALERGDPAILGDDVVRLMGGLDLNRVEDLLSGSKARNPLEERALVQLSVNR